MCVHTQNVLKLKFAEYKKEKNNTIIYLLVPETIEE